MINVKNVSTTHITVRDVRNRPFILTPNQSRIFHDNCFPQLQGMIEKGMIVVESVVPKYHRVIPTLPVKAPPLANMLDDFPDGISKAFKVPAGIGDFSFVYQKLVNLGEDVGIILPPDLPKRAAEFIQMLPRCRFLGYDKSFDSGVSCKKSVMGNIRNLSRGSYYLSANWHLERGENLRSFHPEMETSYHYDMNYLSTTPTKVDPILAGDNVKIGFYTSCYNVLRSWDFWRENEWVNFLLMLNKLYKGPTFYLIGATFDIDLGNRLFTMAKARGINVVNTIGFHISDTIYLLGGLDYLFCFPSGIAVLGDVVDTRTLMFMPPHLDKMINTFGDPDNIAVDRFHQMIFPTPEKAFEWVSEHWKYDNRSSSR